MNKTKISLSLLAVAALGACASAPNKAELDQIYQKMVQTAFRTQGIAKVERISQIDETNRACSEADAQGVRLDDKVAQAIEAANLKTIKWPANDKFLGDWKKGEAIAQSGRGQTWSDTATTVNGGNCYNCHQIDKKEISYGTIGPSLYNYAKLRGVSNPNDPAMRPIVAYTWGKIWNSKAYNACSNMPRAGHAGTLSEEQVGHLVALLLDPNSPVNKD
jgi:sulfur-oxidizing protein SoxX